MTPRDLGMAGTPAWWPQYPSRRSPARRNAATSSAAARAWARGILAEGFIVLDSETTGFRSPTEFVQVAVVEASPGGPPGGRVLVDTLVRPEVPVEPAATRVHGISPAELLGAPAFEEVHPELVRTLAGRRVVAYNAAFDHRVFAGCLERRGLDDARPHPKAEPGRPWECAMLWYSCWRAEPDPRNPRRLKRHKLGDVVPGADHTALGDARATLEVVEMIARGASGAPEGRGKR